MRLPKLTIPAAVLAALVAATCGKSPTAPLPPTLKVSAISPTTGSTTGGATVTLVGTEFTGDATVTIGGIAATSVMVQSTTTMSVVVPSRPNAGPADVVVSAGGKTSTLTNGFTFIAPTGANMPPVVASIRSVGSRPNQPAAFADVQETVTLIATVSDAETPIDTFSYEWSGPGTFTATGATTSWQIPGTISPTPAAVTVTLTVTESFSEAGVTHRQQSSATFVMQVHDSQKEILEAGEDFLTLFSRSEVPTDQVLHNFSRTCDRGDGREAEKSDVDFNRATYIQDFSAFRISRRGPATINFRGNCFLPDGRVQRNVDACSSFAVHWEVIEKSNGRRGISNGVDYVSAALENNQWRLCHSDFIASQGFPSLGIR